MVGLAGERPFSAGAARPLRSAHGGSGPVASLADLARLSTGERQRLALVRSLAAQPAVLLLDEPTASLDQASVALVEALLQAQLRQGLILILVTHAREQATRLAHRMVEMHERKLTRP